VGLEQAVEHLRLGPGVAVAAVGAGEVLELLPDCLLEVVGAVALVARGALDQRVDEGLHVPGGLPDLARQDDARVEADDVVAPLHDGLPPLALDVVLELDAERPVVPGGAQAAVDLEEGKTRPRRLARLTMVSMRSLLLAIGAPWVRLAVG
jgi:hypothetical protein